MKVVMSLKDFMELMIAYSREKPSSICRATIKRLCKKYGLSLDLLWEIRKNACKYNIVYLEDYEVEEEDRS